MQNNVGKRQRLFYVVHGTCCDYVNSGVLVGVFGSVRRAKREAEARTAGDLGAYELTVTAVPLNMDIGRLSNEQYRAWQAMQPKA